MAYAIGVAQPVSLLVETFGTENVDPTQDRRRPSRGVRPAPGRHHPRPRPAPADLQEDRRLRPLRPRRQGVHLGADRPGVDDAEVAPLGPLIAPATVAAGDRPRSLARRAGDRQGRSTTWSPTRSRDQVRVGTIVRVELHGRRVGGWVVDGRRRAAAGRRRCKPLAKVTGCGPAARGGRPGRLGGVALGRAAGVTSCAPRRRRRGAVTARPPAAPRAGRRGRRRPLAAEALRRPRVVLRLPPARPVRRVVAGRRARGRRARAVPVGDAGRGRRRPAAPRGRRRRPPLHARRLGPGGGRRRTRGRRPGRGVGAGARRCAAVRGARRARRGATRRSGRRPGTPATWPSSGPGGPACRACSSSPCPTLEALAVGPAAHAVAGRTSAAGWPVVEVVDRRARGPAAAGPVLRRGWSTLLRGRPGGWCACSTARAAPGCWPARRAASWPAASGAAPRSRQPEAGVLRLRPRAAPSGPSVCLACGGDRLQEPAAGVTRAREELEALAGEPVAEVTGDRRRDAAPTTRVVVGTEAVLHRVPARPTSVAFLDLDQELLRPAVPGRRAGAGAAGPGRPAGRRASERGGRLLLQTRLPRPRVRPGRAARRPGPAARRPRPSGAGPAAASRRPPRWPRSRAPAAPAFVAALGSPLGVEVLGPADGRWLVRAPDHATLCDALAAGRAAGGPAAGGGRSPPHLSARTVAPCGRSTGWTAPSWSWSTRRRCPTTCATLRSPTSTGWSTPSAGWPCGALPPSAPPGARRRCSPRARPGRGLGRRRAGRPPSTGRATPGRPPSTWPGASTGWPPGCRTATTRCAAEALACCERTWPPTGPWASGAPTW